MNLNLRTAIIIMTLHAPPAYPQHASDPCEAPELAEHNVEFYLIESRLGKNQTFIGRFSIWIDRGPSSYELRGSERAGVDLVVEEPYYSIQYLDLSNVWQSMVNIPGSFRGGKKVHVFSKGKKISLEVPLVTQRIATLNAREFRVLLRSADFKNCFVSSPFYGLPRRENVNSLKSVDIQQ